MSVARAVDPAVDHAWYVIQSHPRKESFVRDRITDLGIESFLPLAPNRSRTSRRRTWSPLFPSYLFARLSFVGGDIARVRWSPGVRRLLGDRDAPRPVDSRVIDVIRTRADRAGRVKLGRRLQRGDRVRIVDGPLAGLIGILERSATSPADRVTVLLDLFQRSTAVQLPVDAVWGLNGRW